MSTYKKTAKDLAFDRERQRLQKQIKELHEEIRKYIIEIKAKEAIIEHYDELLKEVCADIENLKELTNIPKQQLETFLKDEREKAERQRAHTEVINKLIKLKQIDYYTQKEDKP